MKQLLDRYIRARYPIIGLITHEENRVLAEIAAVATDRHRRLVVWSYTTGLKGLPGINPENTQEPNAALEIVANYGADKEPVLFVFKDLHNILNQDIRVQRYIRDIAVAFELSKHNVILLTFVV